MFRAPNRIPMRAMLVVLLIAAFGWTLAGCMSSAAVAQPTATPPPAPSPAATPTAQPTAQVPTAPAAPDFASLLPADAEPLSHVFADLDGSGQDELVVVAAFGASPQRLAAERLELFIFNRAESGYTLAWWSDELIGDRVEPLQVLDVTDDDRLEVLSVQSMGASGQTMYIVAWLGDDYGMLVPHGGYFDGQASFGEKAVRLEDADGDGVPEIHAGYGPAASETAIYRWDGAAYTHVPPVQELGPAQPTWLHMSVKADPAEYNPGEPVRLVLTVRNDGRATMVLNFNSGQRFDFAAIDPMGNKVWKWSDGKMFTMALGTLELKAGESLTFEATWDQRDGKGNQVAPARYRAHGWLTATEIRTRAIDEFDIHMPAQPKR